MTGQDVPGCPVEAVFGGADEDRYPCTYAKGHDGPHSFEGPNPPSVADLQPQTMRQPVTFDISPDDHVLAAKLHPVDEANDVW